MKTILKANITLTFSIIFLFIVFVNVNAQETGQWEVLNEGGSFRTIDFVNDQVGWVAGEGTLMKTEDGGDNWNYLPLPLINEWYFFNMDFLNEDVGWIVDYSKLMKTENGGHSWITLELPFIDAGLNFFNVNDTVTYVVGANEDSNVPRIFKTLNGGENWTDISFPQHKKVYYQFVCFLNNEIGIVLGRHWTIMGREPDDAVILSTIDGGLNWNETILSDFSDDDAVYDLQFIDESTALFSARKGVDSNEKWFLYTSTDTGKTWSVKTKFSNAIHSSHFFDNKTGFAIIEDSLGNHNVMKSKDGGLSWETEQILKWRGSKIYFSGEATGYILGDFIFGSIIWRSVDNGNSWIIREFSYPLYDVYLFDKNKGFICGGYINCHTWCFCTGGLLFTADGGETWKTSIKAVGSSSFHSCMFLNNNVGYTLGKCNSGSRTAIYKTTDSGNNWTMVYEDNYDSTGFEFWGNEIFFRNEKNGWVVGSSLWSEDSSGAAILATNDGGYNWEIEWKYQSEEGDWWSCYLNSIYYCNTIGWAVGEGGLIAKYTEQFKWQKVPGVTDLPLRKVFFSDENHGWIAGGYFDEDNVHLIMLKTKDGGENWQEKELNFQINDMFFEDSVHGWAVGEDTSSQGIIMETINGGENWDVQVEELSAPLNALHFKDGYGWAVGGNGLVLRYDGVSWIDQNTGKTYLNKFSLSQNYPNPFNPSTKIKFTLPKAEKVKIDLYNTLGQRVDILLNQNMKAGNHEVEFNAQNLSSGIYFYRIETGEFQDVKKMILLK